MTFGHCSNGGTCEFRSKNPNSLSATKEKAKVHTLPRYIDIIAVQDMDWGGKPMVFTAFSNDKLAIWDIVWQNLCSQDVEDNAEYEDPESLYETPFWDMREMARDQRTREAVEAWFEFYGPACYEWSHTVVEIPC